MIKKGDKYDGIRFATIAFLLAAVAAGIVWLDIPVVGQIIFVFAFLLVIYAAYLHMSAMYRNYWKHK